MTHYETLTVPSPRAFASVSVARRLTETLAARLVSSRSELFALEAPSRSWEARLDAAAIDELSLSYGDQEGLLATHLPRTGTIVDSVGFSSLLKVSLLITAAGEAAGKCTLTVKRGGTLKLGPVYLCPRFRRQRHALAVVEAIAEAAEELGFARLLATVPNGHPAAVTAARAGFQQAARLREHYRPGLDELIFVRKLAAPDQSEAARSPFGVGSRVDLLAAFVSRYYNDLDDRWLEWVNETRVSDGVPCLRFVGKPHLVLGDEHQAAIMLFKRGGTAKVVLASRSGLPADTLLAQCAAAGARFAQRKLSLFWPLAAGDAAHHFASLGYRREALVASGRNGGRVAIHSTVLGS